MAPPNGIELKTNVGNLMKDIRHCASVFLSLHMILVLGLVQLLAQKSSKTFAGKIPHLARRQSLVVQCVFGCRLHEPLLA